MRKQPADHRAMLGSAILNLRSRHATSRSSLARALGASASTLSLYVEQLMAEGYVRETGLDKANLGRPRRLLDLVPEAGWFAGLEFNAQRVSAVVVDFSGRCLNVENQELPEGADAAQVLRSLVNLVDKLRKAQPTPLLGIGVEYYSRPIGYLERIRQVEAKALRKLTYPGHLDKLRTFVDMV